jgi:hypothetical protein
VYIQTISATFENAGQAEDARAYLLANEFSEEAVLDKPGFSLTVFASSDLEAQEAADVFRNYGAIAISAPGAI